MKSIILGVAIATAAVIPASAQPRPTSQPQTFWYLGGGYDHYSAAGISINGGGLYGGWRMSRYLGLELGGQYGSVSGVDLTNGYAQALFLLPLGQHLRLFASAGGAYMTASIGLGGFSVSRSSSGYRAGGGLEYWFTQHWGVRGEFHRQNAGGVADNYGANLAFRF